MTLLDFTMPPFRRLSWVSNDIRQLWEQKLIKVAVGINQFMGSKEIYEVFPVQFHRIETFKVYQFKKKKEQAGYIAEVIQELPDSRFHFASTTLAKKNTYEWIISGQRKAVRAYLAKGIRACGLPFSKEYWDSWIEFDTRSLYDTKWIYLFKTIEKGKQILEINQSRHANFFWEDWGIIPLPFRAPFFESKEFEKLGTTVVEISKSKLDLEIYDDWLSILSWPIEWSALHGIAELKTPLFKSSSDTDATGRKYVIQCHSSIYPRETPRGLLFPYKTPNKKYLSDSKSFQDGVSFGSESLKDN